MAKLSMKKICIVVTAEFAVKAFLLGHIRKLSEIYDVTVIINTSNVHFLKELGINAKTIPLAIERDVNLISDFICLIGLIRIFYHQRFSAVQSITPKAGLLAMLAAWLMRVPLRVHTFTGQVWVTQKGFKRYLLKYVDWLIASLATHNIVDSASQRQFLLFEKVIKSEKSFVFANGSISGVDIIRFKPNLAARLNIRKQLKISNSAVVFLFLGRLTTDKGVLDLAEAFNNVSAGDIHLVFAGPDEQELQHKILRLTENCIDYVHLIGHTDVPEHYMAAADILCLPSYREGFGSVLIEAAAIGLPAIASNIYGISDAVVDGETGVLHPPGDIDSIKAAIELLANNKALRLKLGEQAHTRVLRDFDCHLLTQAWLDFYHKNQ
jgi:glycosyltransferase involved in cell wall biosynthesis